MTDNNINSPSIFSHNVIFYFDFCYDEEDDWLPQATIFGFSFVVASELPQAKFELLYLDKITKYTAEREDEYDARHESRPSPGIVSAGISSYDIEIEDYQKVMSKWQDFLQKEFPTSSFTPVYRLKNLGDYTDKIIYDKIAELVEIDQIKKTKEMLNQNLVATQSTKPQHKI